MRNTANYLFRDGELDQVLRAGVDSLRNAVESIPQAQFVATSTDTLVENLVANRQITPLVTLPNSPGLKLS